MNIFAPITCRSFPFLMGAVGERVARRIGKEYNGGVLRMVCNVHA